MPNSMHDRSSIVKHKKKPAHIIDRPRLAHYPRRKFSVIAERFRMTTCMALMSECLQEDTAAKLVLVSDRLLTLGETTSAEIAMKTRLVGKNWHVLFAGKDVSHANAIMNILIDRLIKEEISEEAEVVRDIFVQAYHDVRKKQIEHLFLSSFGWTIKDFLSIGRKSLPISHYSSLLTDIQQFDLGCEFILCGFEPHALVPDLFVVENPGVATPYGVMGFAAIGAGSVNASVYLTLREQAAHHGLTRTIYNGIAAKAMSEKALGVGRETDVVVVEKDKAAIFLSDPEAIKQIWEEEERFRFPKNWERRMRKLLNYEDSNGRPI